MASPSSAPSLTSPRSAIDDGVALLNSVRGNEQHLIDVSLDRGADVDFFDQDELVHLRTPLRAACAAGNVIVIRSLFQRGASIFAHFLVDRWTALHSAAFAGQEGVVRLLLAESKELHENIVLDGFHLLHILGECLNSSLLNSGADLIAWTLRRMPSLVVDALSSRPGYNEWTPLHVCCARGMTNAAVCLLRAGASLDCRTGDFHVRSPKLNVFARGDAHGRAQVASSEASLNAGEHWVDRGLLPIHLAAFGGHLRTVQMLLKQGQACNAITQNHRWTTLMFATWSGDVQLVRELCRLGGRSVVNLADHRADGSAWTPLALAVAKDGPEMVESLVAYTADPLVRLASADFPGRAFLDHCAPMLPDATANAWTGADRNVTLVHLAVLRGSLEMLRVVLPLVRMAHAKPVRTPAARTAIATVIPWQYPGTTASSAARSPRSPRGGTASSSPGAPATPRSPEGSRRALETARAVEDRARELLMHAPLTEGQECDPVAFCTAEGWSPAVLALLLHAVDPLRHIRPELLYFCLDPTAAANTRADVFLELLSTGRSLLEDRSTASPPVVPQRFQDVSENLVIRAVDEFVRLCRVGDAERVAYRVLHSTLCVACRFNRQLAVRHLLETGLCDPRCRFITPVEQRPLHVATSKGFGYLAHLLIEYRADPLEKDESSELPVYKLTRYYDNQVSALQERIVELEAQLREAQAQAARSTSAATAAATCLASAAGGGAAGVSLADAATCLAPHLDLGSSTAELSALLVRSPRSPPRASPRHRCSPRSLTLGGSATGIGRGGFMQLSPRFP